MFKLQLSIFVLIVAFLGEQSDALVQPPSSRRAFVGRLVTTGAIAITAGANPGPALAVGRRGGKETIDATHNGTDLNGKEAVVASSLLDKMGVADITPDKGTQLNIGYGKKGANKEKEAAKGKPLR